MSASPAATLVTAPFATVATAVFDELHVATAVTSCVVPFDSVAVAENEAVEPAAAAVPLTEMLTTVGAGAAPIVTRSRPITFW